MERTIISIPRVRESWITGLIRMGVLGISGDGLCCMAAPMSDRRGAAHSGRRKQGERDEGCGHIR